MGGSSAPIFISTDGGNTWSLRNTLPAGASSTNDVSVAFAGTGGKLYAGILVSGTMQILRADDFTSTSAMTNLKTRSTVDQPWVVVQKEGTSDDVFVGNNDNARGITRTAQVDRIGDAAAQAGDRLLGLERRGATFDGPPIRLAAHADGTVYAAFLSITAATAVAGTTALNLTFDVVVLRDDTFANDVDTFFNLIDSGDNVEGQRVRTGLFARFDARAAQMGQERLGADLAIAVDPKDSATVWLAWCNRVGGATGTDWTLHVARSTNRGQTWSQDLRTITNAKNPALAVNDARELGLLHQAFDGTNWTTTLEITGDAWATAAETHVLHRAPANSPARAFFPYLGDYVRLLAIGRSFYGVFSGANTPTLTNFPSGVNYQRNANFTTGTLLNTDGISPVAVSIDPFFFHWFPLRSSPISPRDPGPPRTPITPRDPGPIRPAQEPPTDLEL
jgi:hypothetical protein